MTENKRMRWTTHQHEAGVEKFYGKGVENYGEYHSGYLNFGLWENGNKEYVKAAENLVLHMGALLGIDEKSQVLDVACGMGAQNMFMYERFGCRIDALDVTWKHVQRTTERVLKANVQENIAVHHGTATKLPFDAETFSHVMSIEGPEHFNTREDFVKEAFRVLQPDGVMVLADFVLKRKPRTLLDKFIIELGARLWHVPTANYETIESYKAMVERNGFQNVTLEERGKDVIPGYFQEQHRKETRRAIRHIRGWVAAYPGHLIDYAVHWGFTSGLVEYVFVQGEKK
jgi:microcystin synthetase protein McyJ